MQIYNMRVQHLERPIGLHTVKPHLSWRLRSSEVNEKQTAYHIVVASTEENLDKGYYDLWDSGKVISSVSVGIQYDGKELESCNAAYWKVRVWNKQNEESDWSGISSWEMGLLRNSDWQASWITRGRESVIDKLMNLASKQFVEANVLNDNYDAYAPILSKEFRVQSNKEIAKARLYISGLGLYEAHINGNVLGDGTYFNPGESDVRDTIYYVTYDIMDCLNTGETNENVVSFILGNGQYANYKIHKQFGRYYKTDDARSEEEAAGMFGDVKGIAQVVIIYRDGSRDIIGTDDTWSFIESPIAENGWYGGEDYNAMLEIKGWDDISPAIDRSEWGKAVIVKENLPTGKLIGREFQPISISKHDTIPPNQITVTERKKEEGYQTYLIDMGRNGAGFPEITLDTDVAGQMIRMYPAEVHDFTGVGGHINQASCTQSDSNNGNLIYDTYITNDSGRQTYHPRFCYHGYRYLEVVVPETLTLSADNFKGYILRTENEKTGYFVCSDDTLNTINTLTERSIESNMYNTFTDCPQIEKLGWLETPGLMFYSMSQTYDISTWIPKIIQDMVDAQYDNGRIAAIAPEYFKIGALYEDVNWNGSIIITAWQYYETYKDSSVFSVKNYQAMQNYMSYLEKDVAVNYMITKGQMGEWGEMTQYGTTPVVLVETTAYYRLAVTMAKIADVIGKADDKSHYEILAKNIKIAFHSDKTCYNEKNLYGNGTQSSYGCVLYSGICMAENEEHAVELLIKNIEETDYHLTSGEVGLKQVFTVLATHGRSNIIYKMVMNDSMPSYKYFVNKGLTTLPEYWNFEDLWGGFARSLNHAMMGHVKEWFTRYLAGVNPIDVGYDKVNIKPAVVDEITFVKAAVDTVHGLVSVDWERTGNQKFYIKVELPVGIEAYVLIPALTKDISLICNGNKAACNLNEDGSYFVVNQIFGSGTWEILVSFKNLLDKCII